jgi:hypothetical protein
MRAARTSRTRGTRLATGSCWYPRPRPATPIQWRLRIGTSRTRCPTATSISAGMNVSRRGLTALRVGRAEGTASPSAASRSPTDSNCRAPPSSGAARRRSGRDEPLPTRGMTRPPRTRRSCRSRGSRSLPAGPDAIRVRPLHGGEEDARSAEDAPEGTQRPPRATGRARLQAVRAHPRNTASAEMIRAAVVRTVPSIQRRSVLRSSCCDTARSSRSLLSARSSVMQSFVSPLTNASRSRTFASSSRIVVYSSRRTALRSTWRARSSSLSSFQRARSGKGLLPVEVVDARLERRQPRSRQIALSVAANFVRAALRSRTARVRITPYGWFSTP